jgi:hypothetical protein
VQQRGDGDLGVAEQQLHGQDVRGVPDVDGQPTETTIMIRSCHIRRHPP